MDAQNDEPSFEHEEDYVPSPCQNVCVMSDESGYCIGCWRTIEEIMDWGCMSADAKRRVLAELEHRERTVDADPRSRETGD